MKTNFIIMSNNKKKLIKNLIYVTLSTFISSIITQPTPMIFQRKTTQFLSHPFTAAIIIFCLSKLLKTFYFYFFKN